MSKRRLRAFVVHRGQLKEISEERAAKLARAPRPSWRPPPMLLGTIDGVTILYVATVNGPKRCQVATTQARRCAEAAIAVGTVHAVAAFGMAAREATHPHEDGDVYMSPANLRAYKAVFECPVTGCWIWTGSLSGGGERYGSFGVGSAKDNTRRSARSHRLAYETLVAAADGLDIDHLCRDTRCVNPLHLEAVPHRENIRRGLAGLATGAKQRAKTHCPRGHEYAGDNLIVATVVGRRSPYRRCRICLRAGDKARRAKAVLHRQQDATCP